MRHMKQFGTLATSLALALAAAPIAAQEQSDAADSTLSTGTPLAPDGEPVGTSYTAEVHGDWELRCVRTEDGADPCQLYQLLNDPNGASVAEISVFTLPDGQPAAAGATIITPLETLLTQQLTLIIDGGPAKRYPFTFCTQQGCFSRIGLTEDDLAAFRRGVSARFRVVPAAAPDREVAVNASLSGFTAGFEALQARSVPAPGEAEDADGN